MKHIYVDESIHVRGGFIVIAAVMTEHDILPDVQAALVRCGFEPGVDEFKSSMPMAGNENARLLRGEFKSLLFEKCKLAFAVCSLAERPRIMSNAARLVGQLRENVVSPTIIYLDEGIAEEKVSLPAIFSLKLHCNSRIIGGIQLADCAAHIVSTLILSELGMVKKMVPTLGGYPELEVELAWELWSSIRHTLSSGEPIGGYDDYGRCEPMMYPNGLFISDDCSPLVKAAVVRRLGEIWVGCIH